APLAGISRRADDGRGRPERLRFHRVVRHPRPRGAAAGSRREMDAGARKSGCRQDRARPDQRHRLRHRDPAARADDREDQGRLPEVGPRGEGSEHQGGIEARIIGDRHHLMPIVAAFATSHAYTFQEPETWDARRTRSKANVAKKAGRLAEDTPQAQAETLDDNRERYARIRAAHVSIREKLAKSKADAVLLIGDDQTEN